MKKASGLLMIACLPIAAAIFCAQTSKFFQSGPISVKTVEQFTYFCISQKGPYDQLQEAIGLLMSASQQQNVFPAGPMFAVFLNSPDNMKAESLEWEIGFPVTVQALVQPPLDKKQWIFTTVVTCVHQGPYEMTGETILKMLDWMKNNGYEQNGPVLATYPDITTEAVRPDALKTEIWIPCAKKNE